MKLPQNPETDARVFRLTDELFRHEGGRLISVLTGIFGVSRLQMVEDVVQEAMARALKTWPFYGIPANPSAWLIQTGRNLAVDLIRREKRFREKEPELVTYIEQRLPDTDNGTRPMSEDEIQDDRLRLMFACCHPVLPWEMQTALALKVLGGFGVGEIARAFLTTEAAIAKRLTRARQRLQAETVGFEIPSGGDLPPRLDGVLRTLYLLFNEGYKASSGDRTVREELCEEAIRLTSLVAEHPAASHPRAHALLSLMFFNAARLPARVGTGDRIVRLEEQDHDLWNREKIQRGVYHLARASGGDSLSEYHLQAGIAACHCLAPDDASTDWPKILSLYDHLTEIDDSPLVALNRIVALSRVHGPEKAIAELTAILDRGPLESYYLTHAVLGDLERRRDRPAAAVIHFEKALHLAELKPEKAFFARRMRECGTE